MSAKAKEVGRANDGRNWFETNERSPNQWGLFHGEGSITCADKKSSREGVDTRTRLPTGKSSGEHATVVAIGGRPIEWRDCLRNEQKQITKKITEWKGGQPQPTE